MGPCGGLTDLQEVLSSLASFSVSIVLLLLDETVTIYDEAQQKWRKRHTKMNVRRLGHATALVRGVDIGKEAIPAFQHPSRDSP